MRKQIINTAIAIAALAAGTAVYADPAIWLSDGTTTVGPITGAGGAVFYSASVGPNWSVVITSGRSKPNLGSATNPNMDLSIQATSLGSTPVADLSITFSDNGFGPTAGTFTAELTGHAVGTGGTVDYATFLDPANGLGVLTTSLIDSGPVSDASGYNFTGSSSPMSGTLYSLSQVVKISGASAAFYSLDATLQYVPVPCVGQIGDFVWHDTNGNGCQDAGEPGIPGVTVVLYSGCGPGATIVATTTTDSTGHYLFSGLCMGDYQVSITTPAGLIATIPHKGCVDSSLPPDRNSLDSKCGCAVGTPCFVCVTLTSANPSNLNVDCGYITPPNENCAVIVNAVQGVPITPVTVVGSGGCGGPYTFTATGLPNGLTMSSGGTISGTPTVNGTFPYTVTVTDACGNSGTVNCSVTVAPPTPPSLGHGDTATIGFWHNKNGQALIKSLNGGPSSTALGTWLASNYGCLFGNLNGQPNTVVAAQFLTYFNVTGAKTYAQIMAGALADYATSTTLAGGTYAAGYGFNVSPGGTGVKTYNVGSNGTAIGLLNNTLYTVAQLLTAANANCSGGVISPAAFNALNNIFDGINQSGDIN